MNAIPKISFLKQDSDELEFEIFTLNSLCQKRQYQPQAGQATPGRFFPSSHRSRGSETLPGPKARLHTDEISAFAWLWLQCRVVIFYISSDLPG